MLCVAVVPRAIGARSSMDIGMVMGTRPSRRWPAPSSPRPSTSSRPPPGVVDSAVDPEPASESLEARQALLQAEADALRRRWRLDHLLSRTGPVHYAGSYVSGLMVWR